MRVLTLILAIAITGCSRDLPSGATMPNAASVALRNGTALKLLSLDPLQRDPWPNPGGFHNWAILGSTEINTSAQRTELLDSLDRGISEHDGVIAACFEPRHGLNVQYEGQRYDFVICFECAQIQWYIGDERNDGFLVSASPHRLFDQILRDASIQLPEPAH